MEPQSPDYRQLYLREQARREQAERVRQEAETAQQEAERAQQEAQRAQSKTTLPEYLDSCHTQLYLGLNVQTDSRQSTQGDPSNANDKV